MSSCGLGALHFGVKHRCCCWETSLLESRRRARPFVTSPVTAREAAASTNPYGCSLALSVSLPLTKASNKGFACMHYDEATAGDSNSKEGRNGVQ